MLLPSTYLLLVLCNRNSRTKTSYFSSFLLRSYFWGTWGVSKARFVFLQITESTAQFLVRDGGFNLSRRESPPESIANMLTYWLDGMKGGDESCETTTAAAAVAASVAANALQQHQQDMQLDQHEQHEHQQGSMIYVKVWNTNCLIIHVQRD